MLVAREDPSLAGTAFDKHERAVAHGAHGERVPAERRPRHRGEPMRWHDRQFGENARHVRRRRRHVDHERRVVHGVDRVERCKFGGAGVASGRVARRIERERGIVRGGRLAVVPAELPERGQRKRSAIGGPDPPPCEVRRRAQRRVRPQQRDEERIALDLPRQWMNRREGVHALEVRAGCVHDSCRVARRAGARGAERECSCAGGRRDGADS